MVVQARYDQMIGRMARAMTSGSANPFGMLQVTRMKRFFVGLLMAVFVVATMTVSLPASAREGDSLSTLADEDMRLAVLAEDMLRANHRLCRKTMPVTGLLLHTRDQYGSRMDDLFPSGPVAIAAIVPGSPAEKAGLAPGDGLRAINAVPVDELSPPSEGPFRDAVFALLADQDPEAPLKLRVARGDAEFEVSLDAEPGCRALVEILADNGNSARSDGRVIQLSYGLAQRLSDDQLAAAFAHEMGHLVLEHRRRLSEAGISKGFFAEFGRNQQSNRQAEVEADRLSVHLLANAGLAPDIAPDFWLSREGRRIDAGIFRSTIYPSPTARAELMQEEIARHLSPQERPSLPRHLLDRRDSDF